jgi:hypothetical protein
MLNSEEECDDYFGTQKFLNESDFSEKELDVKKDNESFNDSYLVPKEITDNQNIDYPNIANIEAIFNNSEVEQMEEISMSDFMNKKRRKKKKIFYTKKEIDEKYIYKKSKYVNRWITAIIQSYMKKLNEKINEKNSLQKLHTPSYEKFSEVLYYKKNREKFLKKSMKDILKEKIIKKRKDSSKAKDNSYIIEQIEKSRELELKNLLSMNFENVIEEFYKSFDCKMFKFNKEIVTYEREFMKRSKKKNCKSLFEKKGLITLLENKTKRNDEEQEELDEK